MIRAQVFGPWAGDGTEGNSYRPQVAHDYQLRSWKLLGGSAPEWEQALIEVEMDAAEFGRLEVDAEYMVLQWREFEPDPEPEG